MDAIWIQFANFDNLLDLGDTDFACGCHRRVEIAGRLAEHQIARLVRLPALDQADVGKNPMLEDIGLAIEILMLFALGYLRPDAGLGIETRNTRPTGATRFGKSPLWAEFHFQFAGKKLSFEFLVLADIGSDHLLHLPRAEQLAETFIINAGIVRGDGKPFDAVLLDRIDQPFGNSAKTKTTNTQMHVIE